MTSCLRSTWTSTSSGTRQTIVSTTHTIQTCASRRDWFAKSGSGQQLVSASELWLSILTSPIDTHTTYAAHGQSSCQQSVTSGERRLKLRTWLAWWWEWMITSHSKSNAHCRRKTSDTWQISTIRIQDVNFSIQKLESLYLESVTPSSDYLNEK